MDSGRAPDTIVLLVKGNRFVKVVALFIALADVAWAQSKDDPAPAVADGVDGLPGMYRVPVIAEPAPRLGASLWFNYGYTEPQNDSSGAHHRLGGTAAVGGALWPYLSLALRMDARHDMHPDDGSDLGADSGTVIDWAPILRAGLPLGALRLGLEARPMFFGATAPDGVAGPTLEGRVLASFVEHGWAISAFGGYRTPYNGHDSLEQERLRPGDRVALGVSEFGAVTTGLGVMKKFAPVTVFGEMTWNILIGQGAPSAGKSPLLLALGARRELVPGLHLQAAVEIDPAGRPPSLPGDPLVPIEPRVSGLLGLSIRLPDLVDRPPAKSEPEAKPIPLEEEPSEPEVAREPPPPPPARASLRVEIVDETDHPISDARVVVEIPATEDAEAKKVQVPLGEINVYLKDGLSPGKVEVSVEADLLQSYSQQVELKADEDNVLTIKLRKAQGLGGQLRGLVRSYSGEGVVAQIKVQPGDKSVSSNEDGEFSLELPPGNYTVMIEADGYAAQKRPVRIRKDGVTVLNADLHRSN